jgi:cullin-associated NEDD8-dissociated protein 1
MPSLYQETVIKPELIRTVQMGPWTQKFDDGLEARKTAYETMYTLVTIRSFQDIFYFAAELFLQLDTCLAKLDLHEFINRVVQGISDDSDEVKVISHMMLFRLAQLAPTAVAQRLDEITPVLETAVKGTAVTKDTVKQDLERAAELKRSATRAIAALAHIPSEGAAPKWDKFVEEQKRDPAFSEAMKEVRV